MIDAAIDKQPMVIQAGLIVRNQVLVDRLCYLQQRWADEHEYEDWAEYDKAIRGAAEDAGLTAIKTYKRPLGFSCKLTDSDGSATWLVGIAGDRMVARREKL